MDVAVKLVSAIIGFIAGVVVYPYFNAYVIAIIAFLGAVAVGVIVYAVVVGLLANLAGGKNTTRL